MRQYLLLFVLGISALLTSQQALACSCAPNLPQHFCQTQTFLDTPNRPKTIVMAVKLNNVAHGMDMQVVDVLYGSVPDTIRVWGDPGHLCRPYVDLIPIGDTLIMALDSLQYFYDVEDTGDYEISICGVYYLAFENGMVSGRVYEPQQQQMTYAAFRTMVVDEDCNPDKVTSIAETTLEGISTLYDAGMHQLMFEGIKQPLQVNVYDVNGRLLATNKLGMYDNSIQLSHIANGVYLVEIVSGKDRKVQRVAVW